MNKEKNNKITEAVGIITEYQILLLRYKATIGNGIFDATTGKPY